MPNILVINTDVRGSGLSSLAPKERIQEVFGFPPVTVKSWNTIKGFMEKLGSMKTVQIKQTLNGEEFIFPEDRFIFSEQFKNTQGVVIDTGDGIYWAVKNFLMGDKDKMSRDSWDRMTNILVPFFEKVGYMPVPVIINWHDKNNVKGDTDVVEPYAQGSFSGKVGEYFDVIMFTKTYHKKNGYTEFKWQLAPDENHPARCPDKLFEYAMSKGGEIDQDYRVLFKYLKAVQNPKILVIGSYGSGKTHALRTLKDAL